MSHVSEHPSPSLSTVSSSTLSHPSVANVNPIGTEDEFIPITITNCTLWKCTALTYEGPAHVQITCEECKHPLHTGVLALELIFCSIRCWGNRWKRLHDSAKFAPPSEELWSEYQVFCNGPEDPNTTAAPFLLRDGDIVLARSKRLHSSNWQSPEVHHVSEGMYWAPENEHEPGPLYLIDHSECEQGCSRNAINVLDVLQVLPLSASRLYHSALIVTKIPVRKHITH